MTTQLPDGFFEVESSSASKKPSESVAEPSAREATPAKDPRNGLTAYAARGRRNAAATAICCAALLALFVAALGAGRAGVAPGDVVGS